MTKAERNAINAYKKDLIAQGVDKEMAATMAKVFFECGLIKVVVNGNEWGGETLTPKKHWRKRWTR